MSAKRATGDMAAEGALRPMQQPPLVRLRVAVEMPQHSAVAAPLDYLGEASVAPGSLVRVPLGRRIVTGIVWDAGGSESPEALELKPVAEVFTVVPPLALPWRQLVAFAAGYYQRGLGELGLAVLPPELRNLEAAGMERRVRRLHKTLARPAGEAAPARTAEPPVLNDEQAAAVQALAQARTGVTLLHGVTGSGKTEVYLQEARRVLEAGGQALVLVPEINLTPQLEARFAERFPGRRIVSLHSGLTPAQRLQHWLAAHLGAADLVLGTRMAIFASLPRLGLIVVDEEHDPSYKQQEGARYSARDLAVYRAHLEGVPVILGSATPSLETWHNALPAGPNVAAAAAGSGAGRYKRLSLHKRIGDGALPAVRIVDLDRLAAQHGKASLHENAVTPPLLVALQERLARGEQSLVLLNRRGYAPALGCGECGWKSGCPHCSAWRVFHKHDRTLRCHHCGFTERVPRACPDCGNTDIQPLGRGTEKLEEQLATLLPGARLGRIDADTTRLKGTLESQLASVHAGDVDVLVGTQIVAKGHDFRRITLVAALNTDSALFSSDFRAGERLFALLMQAGGRAGRDAAQAARSEMWLQTWHPRHPLYEALRAHDYEAFAASQLAERRGAGLPPFSHLALLRADARTQEVAQAFLTAAAEQVGPEWRDSVRVYPPVPTPIQRVANVERAQLLTESFSRPVLQRFLAAWLPQLHALRKVHRVLRWAVDVDPSAI
jgi:primosomal protein N' (replication factor Y) (superfamily II helicase)